LSSDIYKVKELTRKRIDKCLYIASKDREYLAKASALKYYPLVIMKSKGSYVWDLDGNCYIDFLTSAAVFNIGHTHPRVVKAIKEQIEKYLNYAIIYLYAAPPVELAELLIENTPGSFLKKVTFGFTGSDAVDSAMKAARVYTKRPYIIAYHHSCHGSTYGSLSATGIISDEIKAKVYPYPYVRLAHYPDPYRNVWGIDGYEHKDDLVAEALKHLENELKKLSYDKVAGILFEPIQGDAGVVIPPEEYIKELRKLTEGHGILLLDDEVQSGIGRTGKFWAIEHYGVDPDLLISAKPLGGGMPISAVVGRAEVMESVPPPLFFFTHAGHAVSAVAAIETIKIVKEEKLIERARELGKYAMKRFRELQEKYDVIGDVRGKGLLIGVDLVEDRKSKKPYRKLALKTCWRAWEKGLILATFGKHGNVLRIAPPLTITKEELDKGIDIIEESLRDALAGRVPDEVLNYLAGWL